MMPLIEPSGVRSNIGSSWYRVMGAPNSFGGDACESCLDDVISLKLCRALPSKSGPYSTVLLCVVLSTRAVGLGFTRALIFSYDKLDFAVQVLEPDVLPASVGRDCCIS